MNNYLNKQISTAAKWSVITEIASKLATPISSIILARILTPEAYGAMAAIAIIISFTELFTDIGFKKYLIQHEFIDEKSKIDSANVAFWTNLTLSVAFWVIIVIFKDQLAILVGSPSLGLGIAIACLGIPLAAFSSLQTALYQRDFDFKSLFYARLLVITIPFFITLPLALILKNYWALIIGGLTSNLALAIILSIKSSWKPQLYFNIKILKEMFSFCMWLLLDSILVWATCYIDIFLISRGLNEYYLGLYRTSINIVGQILAIITASILPVLLPALSRLQNDIPAMRSLLLKMQKYSAIVMIPISFGFWIYRDLITKLVLGSQWLEATDFIGIWGSISCFMIVLSRFCTYVYPAIGKPKYSIVSQVAHLIVLVPVTIIAVRHGFEYLYWSRSLVRFQALFIDFILVYILIKMSPIKMIVNIIPELFAGIFMCCVAYYLKTISDNSIWLCFTCLISAFIYLLVLYYIFPKEKELILHLFKNLKKNNI